jgi:hypothetical protein
MPDKISQVFQDEWVSFPGGELEGKRPMARCPECRKRPLPAPNRSQALPRPEPLCFQCYRAEIERQRALSAAGELYTGSEERFQFVLPLEPVDKPRLEMLKASRAAARVVPATFDQFVDRRRRAQIAARHALQSIVTGLRARRLEPSERERDLSAAIRGAELQLPEAWLPFVVSG